MKSIPIAYHRVAKNMLMSISFAFWDYDCLQNKRLSREGASVFPSYRSSGDSRFEPTTFLFDERILSIRLYRQSNLDGKDYSWIIKMFSSVHFTTVHANLIEQTTSSTNSSF